MTARPLLDELRRNARREVEADNVRARDAAAAVHTAAVTASTERAVAARSAFARDTDQQASVARADAERRMNTLLLPARAAALDRVFARALDCIAARASHPGMPAVLRRLTLDALEYLPDGAARVRVAPACADVVREALISAGRPMTSVSEDPTVSLGLVIESDDGAITVNATLVRRLIRDRRALATEVARQLLEPLP